MDESEPFKHSKICFLSNFPPKECGIATFTKDLVSAMNKKFNPQLKSKVMALNEPTGFYNYDNRVIFQLNREDIEDYINMAKKINNSKDIKLVCIQHEFGIFGGEYGNYIIPFLETIEKPVITTFHSVLPEPDEKRKKIVQFICKKSSGVVVMAEKAIKLLRDDYQVDPRKIHLIHHGIPNVPFYPAEHFKKKLKLQGRKIISTFGLLSRGKGIEYMIQALPKLVKKYPNILYLIIGETHPNIRKKEGENYRNQLTKEVEKLGLQNHVKFYNKYLTLQEIIEYLLASDIYVFTGLEKTQITSGTLAYALGCGKAIVSTPISYAEEMLDDERGILAEFKNPESFADSIDKILSDDELKKTLEKNAYMFGRQMIWSNVASRYLNIFNDVTRLREHVTKKFPIIKLNHLKNLTDNFGCIQFARQLMPDKNSGYTADDNSRALIVATIHNSLFNSKLSHNLSKIYLNFLEHVQDKEGNFKNNIKNELEGIDDYSEDSFSRVIWALGFTIYKHKDEEIIEKAKTIFEKAYSKTSFLKSPRARAFSILGLYYYHKKYKDSKSILRIKEIADSLIELYEKQSSGNWQWFEPYLTYSNSKLPEALFLAYEVTGIKKYLEVAEKTLEFLSEVTFINGKFLPVGHNGWYKRKQKRALFDQQPINASVMVQTLLLAYEITQNKDYYNKAILAFNWFLGNNYLNQMVYDESTGGCFDGLGEHSLNFNQGAESTISYLMARLFLEEAKRKQGSVKLSIDGKG